MTISNLYFEAHITIEPVFDDRLEQARQIASAHGFKVADLLMKKREADTEVRSKNDTFMTGHSKSDTDLGIRMGKLILALKRESFKVWRYKLEDTVFDSRIKDVLNLLS